MPPWQNWRRSSPVKIMPHSPKIPYKKDWHAKRVSVLFYKNHSCKLSYWSSSVR